MRRLQTVLIFTLCFSSLALAHDSFSGPKPKVYIVSRHDGFASAITASFFKKHVPVTLILKPAKAEYQIRYVITNQKGRPVAQALAFGLGGIGGFFIGRGSINASITITKGDSVVYAYTAHKKGAGKIQKAAESFAKNFKKWLKKRKHSIPSYG